MINWFDMPAEGLSNGGLFEVKELEVTENGTYETKGEMYNKVTVNIEGGGSSWQTVFEGSVTTVMSVDLALADITDLESLSGDSIKVTFNGTEYILPKVADGYGAMTQDEMPDFSEYPLFIVTLDQPYTIYTETAGTYTLKIEEEQSGGSSDLTWILPEQTVTLVDQPVEVTGLRLDLIPNNVRYVALKSTSAELGGNVTAYYSLQYFNGELATDSGEIFISNIDGKYMFGVTDGESIVANTYTISIALF